MDQNYDQPQQTVGSNPLIHISPEVQNAPPPLTSSSIKKIFFGFLALLVLTGLIVGGYIGYTMFFQKPQQTLVKNALIPNDWKSIESKSCHISLKFPPNWSADVIEGPGGCNISVKTDQPSSLAFRDPGSKQGIITLGNMFGSTWEEIKKEHPEGTEILLAGKTGLKVPFSTKLDPKQLSGGIYLPVGALMFNGVYFATTEQDSQTALLVLSTLTLTGEEKDYAKNFPSPEERMNDTTAEANLRSIQWALYSYISDNKIFPQTLTEMPEASKLLNNPSDKYQYTYTRISDTDYTLTVTLSTGEVKSVGPLDPDNDPSITRIEPMTSGKISPTVKSIATPTIKLTTPTPTKKPYKYSLEKSTEQITTKVSQMGSGYAMYALLRDENGNIITNQAGYRYLWSVDDETILKGSSFEGCTHGIQDPCVQDHYSFSAKKPGKTTIRVVVDHASEQVAATEFPVTVE